MLLFFKQLGASASILGLVTALPPFLTVLQIPAAAMVEKTGYRAFVLRGWTLRSCFILLMAGVAVLPGQISAVTKMALTLFLLFCYSASRGFFGCGFVPWLSRLVPERVLGQFIWRDQVSSNFAIILGGVLTAGYFYWHQGMSGFGVIFLLSFISAMVSLTFLKRIPDVPVPPSPKSGAPVPWREILSYPPFQRILAFNAVMLTGWAGGGVFIVPFLRDTYGLSDSGFLLMAVLVGLFFIVSIYLFGRVIDRVGSKPMLTVSLGFQVLHFLGWGLIAARVVPFTWWSVLIQQFTFGVANAFFQLANTRLVMAIVPAMGRSHFFAVCSVVPNLVLGVLPIFWGLLVDGLLGWRVQIGHWQWNEYSLFYLLVTAIVMSSYYYLAQVEEKQAISTEAFIRDFFVKTPARYWLRLFNRRMLP